MMFLMVTQGAITESYTIMSYTDRHIIETYSGLFEGLSALNKKALIERLTQLLSVEDASKESAFYATFGAFGSDKSAEEIVSEIKESRKFRRKEIKF
jgi:hypothetical protein